MDCSRKKWLPTNKAPYCLDCKHIFFKNVLVNFKDLLSDSLVPECILGCAAGGFGNQSGGTPGRDQGFRMAWISPTCCLLHAGLGLWVNLNTTAGRNRVLGYSTRHKRVSIQHGLETKDRYTAGSKISWMDKKKEETNKSYSFQISKHLKLRLAKL